MNRLDEVAKCFSHSIQLNPASPEVYLNLGLVFKDGSSIDKAEICLQRALELKPDYFEAYTNLGVIQADEAAQCLLRAVNLKNNYPEACNNLGLVFYSANRAAGGVALFSVSA